MDDEQTIAKGVDLLARIEVGELGLAAVLDRIELVTAEPRLQQRILDRAQAEGIITRVDTTIQVSSHAFLRFESDVTTKEGEFSCRRCGSALSTGYFMQLPSGELGPFGSSCIRKVTGRD